MPFLDGLSWVLAGFRYPAPLIPQHHRAAAIFALGDRAFEAAVIKRVILGPHRQALLVGIEAGAIWHRPAFQHAFELQAEVPVEPGGVVLLDDEAIAIAL